MTILEQNQNAVWAISLADKPAVNLNRVAQVYRGKDRTCCCGCAGLHRYASQYQEWSSDQNGYDIGDSINNSYVKKIVHVLNNHLREVVYENNHAFWIDKDAEKIYIAYFVH